MNPKRQTISPPGPNQPFFLVNANKKLSSFPPSSMLKLLRLSSSLLARHSFSTTSKLSSSLRRATKYRNCPCSSAFVGCFHTHKVLAMAETTSSSSSSHKHTNRLSAEHSPYLLQHAHNPVSI